MSTGRANPTTAVITDPTPLGSILGNITSFFTGTNLASQKEVQLRQKTKKGFRILENRGFEDKAFQDMMKKVGWKGGEAWCAYYIKLYLMMFYSFDADFVSKHFTGSAVGNFNTVKALNAKGDKRYIVVTTDTPQVGDVFVYRYDKGGHTGVVKEVVNNNRIVTLEGNTTLSGVREGDGVESLKRNVTVGKGGLLGYIRRNFTDTEAALLYYDENSLSLKFK